MAENMIETTDLTKLVSKNATRPEEHRRRWEGIERSAQAELGDDQFNGPRRPEGHVKGEAMLRFERKVEGLWLRVFEQFIPTPSSIEEELTLAVERWETDWLSASHEQAVAREVLRRAR